MKSRRVASLPLEIVFYFSGWYLVFYCLVTAGLMVYKGKPLVPRLNNWNTIVI